MADSLTRRQFIKISSLGLGGLALAHPALSKLTDSLYSSTLSEGSELLRTPTYCEVCFWKCAGWVYRDKNSRIHKIIGNDEDQHSSGRLCPRGTGGVGMYYDEDRLKTPLIRRTVNGVQIYEKASWNEALEYISAKMKTIREKYGPESMALLTHGSGGKYFGNLMKAYGSKSIAAPSYSQCRGPREVAFIATFGEGVGSPERTDIRDTKCLVLIGAHLGENMHNGQVQEMTQAIEKGAVIITIDPRFSTVASKSKYWLPVKPATDLALLLSWMNVIINEQLYDKNYVEKYTFGFDQLKEHVQPFTPEWAYGITTIKPQIIRTTAREMAKASPSVIVHPGRHVTWYGDDTQRLRAVAILNALLGSWGRRGGFYAPEKVSLPKFHLPDYPKPAWTWKDLFPNQYKLADLALASAIRDATTPDYPGEHTYKGWIVNGTNLISTLPLREKTLAAMDNLELLVVVDTLPMEITGYADVVLPECTYLERYDSIRVSGHRKPQIALRMPAAEPLYDTKPAWWIARRLGLLLGLDAYFPFDSIEKELDWQLKEMGSSLEEMKRLGVKTFNRTFEDLYFADNEEIEFNTNTGKIELYSTAFEDEGYAPLPVYTPHNEPPDGYYRLNYGRAPMHTFGRTSNNPNLNDLMEENTLWVNPKVGKEWGLTTGQYIWLENQDGIVSNHPIKVRLTERIRYDSVYMVHGFGHDSRKLTRAFGRGASDSRLITRVKMDPVMGGTGMRGNFVTFRFEPPENTENVS